jgi:enterochelin esterase family protein
VAEVYYPSSTFKTPRRMHVYTPPGYATSGRAYPVLYLLHGGGDSDDSWWTVGRAGIILDNLIASGKAKPMVVVMPAGHVPEADGTIPSAGGAMSEDPANDPFTADLLHDIVPFVEHNYHVGAARALAGLSMGGLQASNIGLLHVDLFPELLIYSSGWFPGVREKFEQRWGAQLDGDAKRLKLLWVGYGETDIARQNAEAALAMFERHGLKVTSEMTPGGHEWANWRLYLAQTAPLLFR